MASPSSPPLATPRADKYKILVVAPSWIGDAIMMQPLLMRLKAERADAEIHVLAPAWCAPLLKRMPEVTAVIDSPFRHGSLDWAGRKALGCRLAGADFQRAYVLPNSWKSALVPFFAGIPERIGYTGEARFWLLNRRHPASTLPRLVDRYAALAGDRDTPTPTPRLVSTPVQQRAARLALGLPLADRPVMLCPGAEYGPAKRWPTHHFAALARRLAARGLTVWILGSDKDASIGADIARLSEEAVVDLCGRTTLEQAIDLIASARAVVCNDSGLMHVAAALSVPLVALYGSSSPTYTPPLSAHAKIMRLDLDCSPCFKRVCPLGHTRCLEDIQPDQVLAALDLA